MSDYNVTPYREQGTGKLKNAIENQPESTASTVALLKDDFNALLTKLKASGLMVED